MSRIKTNSTGVYFNRLKNGDISYSITYKNEYGKLKRFNVGKKSNGINQTYAKNKRAEFINIINLGEDPLAHKKKKNQIVLDDLANIYFEDKADENKTNDRQRGKYNLHIQPILGTKNIQTISKDDVIKLQKVIKSKNRAAKSVNGIITLLKAIINYNIKEKSLKLINPCIGVKLLKEDDKREKYLSLEEVQDLLGEVCNNEILYHFVKMALTTGARLEGILHIQKKDINLNGNSITIKDLKSGGTYTGFYSDEYKIKIENYSKHLKKNDYFIGSHTMPVAGRTMRRWMKPVLDKLFNEGLDSKDAKHRVVIHTLRHTFASQLAIAGVPILTIKNLMNHADIEQTMRYAKLAPDQGIDAVKGLYNV